MRKVLWPILGLVLCGGLVVRVINNQTQQPIQDRIITMLLIVSLVVALITWMQEEVSSEDPYTVNQDDWIKLGDQEWRVDGWGEAPSLPTDTGNTQRLIVTLVRRNDDDHKG